MWRIIDRDLRDKKGRRCHRVQCGCGKTKLVLRWNIDANLSTGCQKCHLDRVRTLPNHRKLTNEQMAEVRASTEPDDKLALRYNVAKVTVRRARNDV